MEVGLYCQFITKPHTSKNQGKYAPQVIVRPLAKLFTLVGLDRMLNVCMLSFFWGFMFDNNFLATSSLSVIQSLVGHHHYKLCWQFFSKPVPQLQKHKAPKTLKMLKLWRKKNKKDSLHRFFVDSLLLLFVTMYSEEDGVLVISITGSESVENTASRGVRWYQHRPHVGTQVQHWLGAPWNNSVSLMFDIF